MFESHLSSGPSLVQIWLRLAIASLVVLSRERASSLHSTLCSQVSLVLSTLHFYKRAAPAEYRIHANGGVHKSASSPPQHQHHLVTSLPPATMDGPIALEGLIPTTAGALSSVNRAAIALKLQKDTRSINCQPYEPEKWLSRSETLATLGYPELATGDAHKALLLCKNLLDFVDARGPEGWALGSGKGFWMRTEETDDEINWERADEMKSSLSRLHLRAQDAQASNIDDYDKLEGSYIPQPYPWLDRRHRARDDELLNEINGEIDDMGSRLSLRHTMIEVRRCTFHPDGDINGEHACFGVFAKADIRRNTTIVSDQTTLFGCTGVGIDDSTMNLHGAEGCDIPHHPNLPGEEGALNLRWVRERTGVNAPDHLLLCRALLKSVQDDVESPFDLPIIARLTPSYHRQEPRSFQVDTDLEIPTEALQKFGVDIFADHRYDTWVLFTLSARLRNNCWSNPINAAISPIFCMFNHSCEPNVKWAPSRNHCIMEMHADRDIVAGEQLFIEYDAYHSIEPLKARRERLNKWIDQCMCPRCVREEEAMEAMEVDGDGESSGLGTGGQGARPAWDQGDETMLHGDEFW